MRPAIIFSGVVILSLMLVLPCHAQSVIGNWQLKQCEIKGEPVSAEALGSMKLTLNQKDFTAMAGGKESSGALETERGDRTTPGKMTFSIDSGSDSGRELKAIFKRKGTNLIVAFSPDNNFPADFDSSAANNYAVMTYSFIKRKKKKVMTSAERRANRAPTVMSGVSGGG